VDRSSSPGGRAGVMSVEQSRGQKLYELNAIPAKEVLLNKARVCPPLSALCEIVDNIFDNFEENGRLHDLSISFLVEGHGVSTTLSILENSGGVRREKLEPLVRLGVAYHGARGSIGTWGEGLKVAVFSLGNEVDIRTWFPSEQPVALHFPPDWMKSKDWSVPVYAVDETAMRRGSTTFTIQGLYRLPDWGEMMRELGLIYGHKIHDLAQAGRRVRMDFDINGSRAQVRPRPLATAEALQQRLAYPPEFEPRLFTADLRGEHSTVHAKIVVGLTARHSGETSGLYLYGNGRLFARAFRARALGYGQSGNSVLRDHPSCWRVHAYIFLEADDGSEIPWQAPLKDGVSENHVVTGKLREILKDILAPYARFAKIAKASELVPYTGEWGDISDSDRANIIFGKDGADSLDRYKDLPKQIREFTPPKEVETLHYDGLSCERMLRNLADHAKYAGSVIRRRDADGYGIQEQVLRALNPKAFGDQTGSKKTHQTTPKPLKLARTKKLSVVLRESQLSRLRSILSTNDDREAVVGAVEYTIRTLGGKALGRKDN
jgi:hypothetical protein